MILYTFKKLVVFILAFALVKSSIAQTKVDRIIIITTDGLRWQELFTGLDSSIANQNQFNQDDSLELLKNYWHNEAEERRILLMPFFWNTIVKQGQVYGNRYYANKVNTANPFRFSYPGYNEIFTGYADTAINSNQYPPNPHINILEFLNQQPGYKNKVAAFTAWEAFNRILNEQRSNMPVVAAFDTLTVKNLTPQQKLLNTALRNSYRPWGEAECLDVFTHYAAMEFLGTNKPKALYISYGETDEWAHSGQYRDYLNATHQFDKWLQELWNFVQSDPLYKNKTALFITTDHGRGKGAEWTKHGSDVNGAEEIWFAVLAPGLPAKGEIKTNMQLYQNQFAATIMNILGVDFKVRHPIGGSLVNVFK